jgi:preprotein translocase subunit SecA
MTAALPKEEAARLVDNATVQVRKQFDRILEPAPRLSQADLENIYTEITNTTTGVLEEVLRQSQPEEILDILSRLLEQALDGWRMAIGVKGLSDYQRILMLQTLDSEWQLYLTAMDDLRQGIGLQAVGQRDPLIQYQTEGYRMFSELLHNIDRTVVRNFFHKLPHHMLYVRQAEQIAKTSHDIARSPGKEVVAKAPHPIRREKLRRNDPCPCGSGKRFKDCHLGSERELVQLLQTSGNGGARPAAAPTVSTRLATGGPATVGTPRNRAGSEAPKEGTLRGKGGSHKQQSQVPRGKVRPLKGDQKK